MLSNKIFLLLMILISATCFSQNDKNTDIRNVTKVTFFDPGISYEKKIGKLQSLYAQAFLSTAISLGYSSSFGNTSSINGYPALTLQYRYYYNAAKRKAKGKRTEMNSLNYVSALAETDFYRENVSSNGEKKLRALKIFGAVWGFQRNYRKRFSLDLNLGVGYVYKKETTINDAGQYATKNVGEFTNVGQIGLGFWLNRRN
jgi:hypothetical protein